MAAAKPFDPIEYAREELAPLLRAICRLNEEAGNLEQKAYFTSILEGIGHSRDAASLADPFMELSMAAFMGFRYEPSVAFLLDELLGKAQRLTEVLALDETEIH